MQFISLIFVCLTIACSFAFKNVKNIDDKETARALALGCFSFAMAGVFVGTSLDESKTNAARKAMKDRADSI